MAFWFGVTSMVRTAGLQTTSSSSSIPQTSSRNVVSALMTSSLSASLSSTTTQQPRSRQQETQNLTQTLTEYQEYHKNARSPPLSRSYLSPGNSPSSPTYGQYQPRRIGNSPAPASSRCSYCLTGTSFSWTSADDDQAYEYEVAGLREQDRGCRWTEREGLGG